MNLRIALAIFLPGLTWTLLTQAEPDNHKAWELLLENKPREAEEIFRKNSTASDPKVAGEACRGAGIVARFMGHQSEEMKWVLAGFKKDKDTLALMAGQIRHLNYGDAWDAFKIKDAIDIGNEVAQHPSLLTSSMIFELARRRLNDGEISKAEKLLANTGLIRQWWAIGPFSNISGSGFDKAYPPETGIELNKVYPGKNGDKVRWFPLNLPVPAAWIFINNHVPAANAIIYFSSQVESPVEQKVNLAFGASGSFKVFVNDKLVLAERIFRNTGADVFTQAVSLRKGPNRILVKLGNEERYSNFLLRFSDTNGKGIVDLKTTKPEGGYPHDPGSLSNLKSMPAFDRELAYLHDRLKKNSNDVDAALLIMDMFNVHEMTDSGEVFGLKQLEKHPGSSLWLSLLSESLIRSRQITRAQEFAKSAYQHCELSALGWNIELNRLASSASPEAVLEFIRKSPPEYRENKDALMGSMAALGRLGRRDEVLKAFAKIEKDPAFDHEIANLLAIVYQNQGRKSDAIKAWKKLLSHGHLAVATYQQLADLYLKAGDLSEAVDILKEATQYIPDNPNPYLFLSNIYMDQKKFSEAEKYLSAALALAPYNALLLGEKGTLKSMSGDAASAKAVLKQSVESNYNDFPSWDKLRQMDGLQAFESIASLPNLDSLIKAAKGWEGLKRERGAILSYIEDVFFYPSRAVRHRGFLVVHLPSQDAVNYWKQYSVPYNSSFQTLGISRAVSHKAAGTEVDAEISGQNIVFKSLEPGDCVVVEWTLKDDYDGEMARQAWGEFDFKLSMPTFDSRLRLFMAGPDTIGYTIRGQAVNFVAKESGGVKQRIFSRGPYNVPVTERFLPTTDETKPDVLYSTFSDWGQIADWYANLVENKTAPGPILHKVADSLFAGAGSDSEKVARVQRFVTSNIAYSSLSFRQSGWIPQSAQEVLASRLGDCKDMAALAKSLLNLAGLESHLVLVATRDEFGTRPGPIGPHFNHCILSYPLGGKVHYMDLTDPHLYWTRLPKGDQGAIALVIKRGNQELINLPIDISSERRISRNLKVTLSDSGVATIAVQSVRLGIFARSQRESYRHLAQEERKQEMLHTLADDYADIVLDSIWFGDLEPSTDSVQYNYTFQGRQAVKTAGPTRIFNLYIPDKVSSDDIPDGQPRPEGADLSRSWFSSGSYSLTGSLVFPARWKLLNRPSPIHLKSPYGEYSMIFSLKGNVLTFTRKARLEMEATILGKDVLMAREFLNQIVKSDDVQLVFTEKAK
jgi:tetratricopeptide (TPR) repeat protein